MIRLLALLLLVAALPARAQELVTLETRPGARLSFFITGMGDVQAKAVGLMLIGGGGKIRLREENGKIKFSDRNFLPRSREEFVAAGIRPVILDSPTDQQEGRGMTDEFRMSAAHVQDLRAVLAEVKKRFPGLPVFLLTTSRSTLSGAYLARALGGELAGVALTSSLFRSRNNPMLAAFDFGSIRIPILFVHHRDDGCRTTPYFEAERLGAKYPLISVSGGKPPQSDPCEPLSAHGYFGNEAETVAAIAAWMLGKPYPKDIR